MAAALSGFVGFGIVAIVAVSAGFAFVNRNRTGVPSASAICASDEHPTMTEDEAGMITASKDDRFGS